MSAETAALKAVRNHLRTPSSGLLLIGPPGVGKTRAVHLAANELSLPVHTITAGANILQRIRKAFQLSTERRHVIFLDEMDAICTPSNSGQIPRRATSLLISLLDPPPVTNPWQKRVSHTVIAATNRVSSVDGALRRARRFEQEVVLKPPDEEERFVLLRALRPDVDEGVLRHIAGRTRGFVAADFAAASRRAEQMDKTDVGSALNQAVSETIPAVLRYDFISERPAVKWEDVGGLEEVKRRLKTAVEWPYKHRATFQRLGLQPPRGILLHGPPGVAKTTLVRAAASESGMNLMHLSGADMYSCYVGEAERIVREAFARARTAAPCILFVDELDAVVGKRGEEGVQQRLVGAFLTEMDGVAGGGGGVLVMAATNRVDLIDEALLRPGRFDDVVKVGEVGGGVVLRAIMRNVGVGLEEIERKVEGWGGGEVRVACVEAGVRAAREWWEKGGVGDVKVCARHFEV